MVEASQHDVMQSAEHALLSAVGAALCALGQSGDAAEIARTIKAAMHAKIPVRIHPQMHQAAVALHALGSDAQSIGIDPRWDAAIIPLKPPMETVFLRLSGLEADRSFNHNADAGFPDVPKERQSAFLKLLNCNAAPNFSGVRKEHQFAIIEFLRRTNSSLTRQGMSALARTVWRLERGRQRRALKAQSAFEMKGRPPLWDPDVVFAFEQKVASAFGRERVTFTRLADNHQSGHPGSADGPVLRVLQAAIHWAMTRVWSGNAPHLAPPPVPKLNALADFLKDGKKA